jgi:hypothetical protein
MSCFFDNKQAIITAPRRAGQGTRTVTEDTARTILEPMRAGSADPARVAQQLRLTRDWKGVTGAHSFDEQGNPVAKRLAKVVVRHGKFEYFDLPGGGT